MIIKSPRAWAAGAAEALPQETIVGSLRIDAWRSEGRTVDSDMRAELVPGGMPADLTEALDYFDQLANREDFALRWNQPGRAWKGVFNVVAEGQSVMIKMQVTGL